MFDQRTEFIGPVADILIVRNRDAVITSTVFEPNLVWRIGRKKIVIPFDRQTGGAKNLGKLLA